MITHARYSAQTSTLLRHDSIQALNTTPCYIMIEKWWIPGCELLGTRGYSHVTFIELIAFWKGTGFVEVHTIPETDLLFPVHISHVHKRVKAGIWSHHNELFNSKAIWNAEYGHVSTLNTNIKQWQKYNLLFFSLQFFCLFALFKRLHCMMVVQTDTIFPTATWTVTWKSLMSLSLKSCWR